MTAVESIFLAPHTKPFVVAVARTKDEHQRGLQDVDALTDFDGMLFEYPYPSEAAFWMKDTPMPLTIAWFNRAGLLLGTAELEAFSERPVYAPSKYSYVLEVPQGSVDFFPEMQLRVNHVRKHEARRGERRISQPVPAVGDGDEPTGNASDSPVPGDGA